MIITPLTAGYNNGMENFYTHDESELNNRKILIDENLNKSWFKCGDQDPYIENILCDLKVGDIVTIKFDIMSPIGKYNIYLGDKVYIKDIPKNSTVKEILHLPVLSDIPSTFLNFRGCGKGGIFSNIQVTCSNKKEYTQSLSLRSNSDFVNSIYDSKKYDLIFPEGVSNFKRIKSIEEYGNGNISVENNRMTINFKTGNTYGPVIPIPKCKTEYVCVLRIKYVANVAVQLNLWGYGIATSAFGVLPLGNQTVYKIVRLSKISELHCIVFSGYNLNDGDRLVIEELDFCVSSIGDDKIQPQEGWGHIK